jgi:multidrug resistance efflux pump
MKINSRTMFIILGMAVLLASAIGAGVALRPGAAESPSSASDDDSTFSDAIFKGFVDVDPKVGMLYPSMPGKIERVVAEEGLEYEQGATLLVLDRRLPTKALTKAEKARDAARLQLSQARLGQQEWQQKIELQCLAIQAAAEKLAQSQEQHTLRKKQLKNQTIDETIANMAAHDVTLAEIALRSEWAKFETLSTVGLQDVENKVKLAEAALAGQEVLVEEARLALDECELKAPVKGKVLRVHVARGEVLGPQPRLAAIEFYPTDKPLIVRVEVEQEFARFVAAGKPARIEDDTRAGKHWTGKVVRVSDWYTHRRSMFQEPLNYNDVRTLECIVALDPGQSGLRIGQRIRAIIGRSR